MAIDRREIAKRFRKRIEVRYGPEDLEYTGYSGNISSTGIMVRAVRVFGPGMLLNLELKFPHRTIRVQGRVSWAREGSVQLLSTGRIGMGIKFIDPPRDLIEALE